MLGSRAATTLGLRQGPARKVNRFAEMQRNIRELLADAELVGFDATDTRVRNLGEGDQEEVRQSDLHDGQCAGVVLGKHP